MKKLFFTLLSLFIFHSIFAQQDSPLFVDSAQLKWVDAQYDKLSLEEKVGQLFIVAAYSNRDESHYAKIEKLVAEQGIGGVIFMQDDAPVQAELTNRYNKAAKIPLLIGIDGEWGLAMRIKGVKRFPWAMTVGAVEDNELVKEMGRNIGEQTKRLGVGFNFAPDADVNTNPENPVIGNRSYGSDVDNVTAKGIAYMQGMMEQGILASAKHFPGHGDTQQDSHKTTPVVAHDREHLNNVELASFQKLIDAGVPAIMVAHLNVPALDDSGLPSSISKKIITDVLKNEMNFKGIVITDALNMTGVTQGRAPGEVEVMAFEAGNDILLFAQNVGIAKQSLLDKINVGEISEERLEESVKKILMAKYFVGLNNPSEVDPKNLPEELNKPEYAVTNYKLYENAATLVKNENNLLPVKNLEGLKVAFVPLEGSGYGRFAENLNFHAPTTVVDIKAPAQISKLDGYDLVIIGVHKSDETVYKSYKSSANTKAIIKAIGEKYPSVLVLFTSPYGLRDLDLGATQSILVMYQNNAVSRDVAAGLIFGAAPIKGRLPVDVNEEWKFGESIKTQSLQRLGFAHPEDVGVSEDVIYKADDFARRAISEGATPGLQLIAARNGRIIYDKAMGYQSIAQEKEVSKEDLYDVASVTKVTATLPLLMEEVDSGEITLDRTLGSILPEMNRSDKGNLKLREILSHQSGLPEWIGFYKESVNVQNARLYLDYYSRKQDEEHPIKVTDNIYIIGSIRDTIMTDIMYAPLGPKKYKYSDLGYYLFQDYLEKKNGLPLDSLLQLKIYGPMQMTSTTYNPKNKFGLERIIPTQRDKIYRNQLIHGFVQDEGAAMMGGVAGHAGLFSTAEDLAKLMQMYLNGGNYGGVEFFRPETLAEFTKTQYAGNRRGAGFDKLSNSGNNGYGHFGYTGTMVWNDPDEQLLIVFLSNRLNSEANGNALSKKKVRENIRQAFYEGIVIKN